MIVLLDCTLRDGGFVNDWEFGYSSIRSIVGSLDKAGIEIIEVGFIDNRRLYDPNRSIFPDTESINKTFAGLFVEKAMLVAMIDYGTCIIDSISDCEKSVLDGIRVIFKKKDKDEALAYCKKLKEKGYKVFLNPVSITGYSDRELLELVEQINAFAPYAMSIVDTYGLMLREEIMHYVDIIDHNLNTEVLLAYHSHNNQQMAYSNCCAFSNFRTRHNLVLDATLFGMGKSAGNANTELVASYVNRIHGGNYVCEQMLDCIYTDIMRIYKETPWGYNLHYYISALNDCHPNYVNFLLEKNTLSVQSIYEILADIPKDSKLTYSENIIAELYKNHQSLIINDEQIITELKSVITHREVLLLYPGSSIREYESKINAYIDLKNPIIIAVNFIPKLYYVDYVFVSNRIRYRQLADIYLKMNNPPLVLATSNIMQSTIPINYKLNYESLISDNKTISDNGAIMSLNMIIKLEVNTVAVAGMDGFSSQENFSEKFMDMYDSKKNRELVNVEQKQFIKSLSDKLNISFITPSLFLKED